MVNQGTLFQECSHARTTVVPEKRGPHHAKQVCSECGKFLRWMPKPETVLRHKENQEILTALTKLVNLPAWERNFVRKLVTHKNISPKQQKTLLELGERYLGRRQDNDGFNGVQVPPN